MSFHGDGGFDDKDLDDAALWAVIDSAAASLSTATTSTSKYRKPLATRNLNRHSPIISFPIQSPPPSKNPRNHRMSDGEVLHENPPPPRPHKIARSHASSELATTSPPALVMVKHVQRTPTTTPSETYSCSSPDYPPPALIQSPIIASVASETETEIRTPMIHSLSGRFPSVSLFKDYQNAAMAILEKSDYTMISGSPYIKKTGWRKISFYFNLSFEIKDKTIEFDENRNVQRAEFIVRAHMQGGRFSDGWGSCERREKRFLKPNHDIPSTAETRAKNKACQDLLGIGEYRPGLNAQK